MQYPENYPKPQALNRSEWRGFSKDTNGASIAHTGPNRAERNRARYLYRTGYVDSSTGKYVPGYRTKRKRELRKFYGTGPLKIRAGCR